MSRHHPIGLFGKPSRQGGAIGLIAAVTLGLGLLCMLMVVDTGRLYLEKRKLQRVADMAALEAASRGGNCLTAATAQAYATASAGRNGFTITTSDTVAVDCGSVATVNNLRVFTANASVSDAIRVTVRKTVPTSIASGIGALFSGGSTALNTTLTATAVGAAPKQTLAQLSIRSSLLNIDAAKSPILNAVASGLLGGNINLSAVGWNGLLNTNVSLLSYLDQLAIVLNVKAGDYDTLLNTNATVTQLLTAAATLANLNGAMINVATQVGTLNVDKLPLKAGDLLQLQAGTPTAALETNVQLFQLVQGFIQVANGKNAVATSLPLDLLGLASVNAQIRIIQPPQFSVIGDPRLAVDDSNLSSEDPNAPNQIRVQTAQIRILISVKSTLIDSALQTANLALNASILLLNTAAATSCLFTKNCTKTDLLVLPAPFSLDIGIEAGSGLAHAISYTCQDPKNKSLTTHNKTSALTIKAGHINPDIWLSSSTIESLTPLTLLDIGSYQCTNSLASCGPRTAFGGGGLQLNANVSVAETKEPSYTFQNPPEINQSPLTHTVKPNSQTIVSDLINNLTNNILIVHPASGFFGTLAAALTTLIQAVTSALTSLIGLIVDPVVNLLLTLLGIDINQVIVGANLTCGQPGKAYLVL